MKDAILNVVGYSLWIGVPVAGLVAGVLVAYWPLWSVSRWWSLTYAALVTALSTWITVTNWSPDNESNGIRLAAVVLAGGALATSLLLWRLPPHGRASGLVRALATVACFFSAVMWVFVLMLGSPKG
jgi:hypothetical protein